MLGHGHVTPRPDGMKARCGGPGICAECSREACTQGFYGTVDVDQAEQAATCPKCRHTFPLGMEVRVTESEESTEALVNGQRSYDDVKELVRKALRKRIEETGGSRYAWVHIADLTDSAAVYMAEPNDDLYQCDYSLAEDGTVTLGDPVKVLRSYTPAPTGQVSPPEPGPVPEMEATEAEERDSAAGDGRLVEAKGKAADGGRVFRMKIISYGDSKNARRYPESVMRQAAGLYEGARAYDHHRTGEELRTGTTAGMVGYYRNVEAEADGIYGDLHLLPSSKRAAEALDATLGLQAEGLDPLLGVSHDVYGRYRPIVEGGRRLAEATAITKVNSVDLVAVPAAGGQATRMVAGGEEDSGTEPEHNKEAEVPTMKEILAALKEASPEELAELAEAGLVKAKETQPAVEPSPPEGEPAKEGAKPEEKATEAEGEPKDGFLGTLLIKSKVEDAGLPASVVESLTASLPERITEGDVDNAITTLKSAMSIMERAELRPTATVQVTQEERDKKVKALENFFARNWSEGYHSFRQAYLDFTGARPAAFDADLNRQILQESYAGGFDSGARSTESLDSTSWAQILGDSVTRRMIAMYRLDDLQTWRRIVSSITPVNDFRTQRPARVGGYGTLPIVNESAPYQPLTSPPDEEATYAIDKRGGTEDLTLEMVANDDVRAIANIPNKLGRAAAQTLFRFVWDMLRTNITCTYDSTALFDANHSNTSTNALSETALSTARQAMREQTAYGDSVEVLNTTPSILVVPPALETLAFKLTTSVVSVGGNEDRTTPNIHSSLTPIIVPYFSDPSDWYLAADPNEIPTIEVGFYQGRQEPELFSQTDPTQGSAFSADKITWKIRHIYSGTVLDHRGFYGAVGVA